MPAYFQWHSPHSMTELDDYLSTHYLTAPQVARAAGISADELEALIGMRLVPAPSYVVNSGTVTSFVFGAMDAPGSTSGRYFHPSQRTWIIRARAILASGPAHTAKARLQEQFRASFSAALAALNGTTWRMADSFDDAGAPIPAGLALRLDSAWNYFLNGTFGLCVANPATEAQIANKEVLQEKLVQLSENGNKADHAPQQLQAIHALIDAYAAAAMPFSPVDYPVSSRKRLVEDLRNKLQATEAIA
jgi:hypothetical protein